MNIFKFKAEVEPDIVRFREQIGIKNLSKITVVLIPLDSYIEVTIETEFPIDTIKKAIQKVEDGHVMLETLTTEDAYTGIRVR